MVLEVSPEVAARVAARAEEYGLSVDAYLDRLVGEEETDQEFDEPLDENDPEFQDLRAAVEEGLMQAERGEGSPAEEVFAEFRARHGLPR